MIDRENVGVGADPFGGGRGALVRSAARLLGSREAGEDAVQEAALRALERLGTGAPPPEAPDAWLATVTRRLAIDRLRRERLERAGLETGRIDGSDGTTPGPEEALLLAERRRVALARLLDVAAVHDAAAVLLHEAFGVGYADIARGSGRGVAAWRQAVRRALERARRRGPKPGGAGGAASAEPARTDRTGGADGRGEAILDVRHATDAFADGVLDRFDRALAERDARPLFDALRIDAVARRGAAVRFELDGDGARLSLVLDGIVLCRLGPPGGPSRPLLLRSPAPGGGPPPRNRAPCRAPPR